MLRIVAVVRNAPTCNRKQVGPGRDVLMSATRCTVCMNNSFQSCLVTPCDGTFFALFSQVTNDSRVKRTKRGKGTQRAKPIFGWTTSELQTKSSQQRSVAAMAGVRTVPKEKGQSSKSRILMGISTCDTRETSEKAQAGLRF